MTCVEEAVWKVRELRGWAGKQMIYESYNKMRQAWQGFSFDNVHDVIFFSSCYVLSTS
jgi:hypothetical protein